mmetsp:Transcript_36840/g.32550  ORF Transcript_36840/g.32550 Transcript_36840/m.32550 type:complete len:219 (+) Transcript_36840:80-736(+)
MNKLYKLPAFKKDELLVELVLLWFDGENIFNKIGTSKINDLWKTLWFAKGKQQVIIDSKLNKFEDSINFWYENYENESLLKTIYEKLSVIILFDQVTRNIFRGKSKAYKYDHIALKMTKDIIQSIDFESIHDHLKIFLILPLIHSEDISDIKLAQSLCNKHLTYPYDWIYSLKGILTNHSDRILLFGRIPERQSKKGENNTEKEKIYLQNITFSQKWK